MRIVFITTKLNFVTSGASVEELDLKVRAFMERGHECRVVTMFSSVNVIDRPLPYQVIEEYSGSGGQLAIQSNVYRALKRFEGSADIFYIDGQVFLYGAGLYRLLGGKRPICAHFNRELIAWQENVSSSPKYLKRRVKEFFRLYLEKWFGIPLANYMDALSFTNPYLEETYQRFGLHTAGRSLVVGDAFEYKKFMEKYGVTEETYSARNKQDGVITIYYSSRMAPGKGFDTLVEAFSKLPHKEHFRMILGGKGPEDEKIQAMVHDLGLERYVEFTGWAPKPEHYARLREAADILVQPSQSGMDKTSYILLESMAFGVPSILPGGGGLEWDAQGGALYFKAGDTDDLAQKIEELGRSPELRAELSKKCYERLAEQEMDYRYQVGRWEAKMQELLFL